MSAQLNLLAEKMTQNQSLVVITGAGISAESGIATFRGVEGYWSRFKPEELASAAGFQRDPELVWRWYDERRRQILSAAPNPGHYAIAELEKRFPQFTLITQNVDGLHQQAGSQNVIEIHGSIWRVRCLKTTREWDNTILYEDFPVYCKCGGLLRPAVLWFGESYHQGKVQRAIEAVSQADHVLIVGTSGMVWIVSGLMEYTRPATQVIEFNLERTELSAEMDGHILGPAGETLPKLLAAITINMG